MIKEVQYQLVKKYKHDIRMLKSELKEINDSKKHSYKTFMINYTKGSFNNPIKGYITMPRKYLVQLCKIREEDIKKQIKNKKSLLKKVYKGDLND